MQPTEDSSHWTPSTSPKDVSCSFRSTHEVRSSDELVLLVGTPAVAAAGITSETGWGDTIKTALIREGMREVVSWLKEQAGPAGTRVREWLGDLADWLD